MLPRVQRMRTDDTRAKIRMQLFGLRSRPQRASIDTCCLRARLPTHEPQIKFVTLAENTHPASLWVLTGCYDRNEFLIYDGAKKKKHLFPPSRVQILTLMYACMSRPIAGSPKRDTPKSGRVFYEFRKNEFHSTTCFRVPAILRRIHTNAQWQ